MEEIRTIISIKVIRKKAWNKHSSSESNSDDSDDNDSMSKTSALDDNFLKSNPLWISRKENLKLIKLILAF
jgi:hypothetical protein